METIKIQGKSYAMVVERVKEFNKQFPDGSLITEIVSNEDGVVIMKASAIVNGIVVGTGHSFETVGSSQINKSSHLENCETSAIGRCLAFGCGFKSANDTSQPAASRSLAIFSPMPPPAP